MLLGRRLKDYTTTREELEARAGSVPSDVASGKLKLRIAHVYQLADAASAHRDLEAETNDGQGVCSFPKPLVKGE